MGELVELRMAIIRSIIRPILVFFGLILLQQFFTGCLAASQKLELVKDIGQVKLPPGAYRDIAWLRAEELAVSYAAYDSSTHNLPGGPDLHEFEINFLRVGDESSLELEVLTLSEPENECFTVWKLWVERLPDDKLGISRTCNFWRRKGLTDFYTEILAYDANEDRLEMLFKSRPGENIMSFSFAPDMSVSIQTLDMSGGLVPRLVLVDEMGTANPLFGNFRRARGATFSPASEAFAFFGNETLSPLRGFPERWNLAAQLAHPWKLYVIGSMEMSPRAVLEVRRGSDTKWSPAGPYLAFRGQVQTVDGIWIFHLDTESVYRVWNRSAVFDWSPDGQRIAVVDDAFTVKEGVPSTRLILLTVSLPP